MLGTAGFVVKEVCLIFGPLLALVKRALRVCPRRRRAKGAGD
jgi:hypothetical protein